LGLTACDETIIVGYNDVGLLISPESCGPNASFRACTTETCVVSQLGTAQLGRETIAVDADALYFIAPTDVLARMPKDGGPILELATGALKLQRLTLDQTTLYWTNFDGEVFRVPKDGSAPATLLTKVMAHPISIAADDAHLYLAMTDSGEIAMVTKREGTATLLAGQGTPVDLGIDGEHVWWIDQGDPGMANGGLVRVPRGDLTNPEIVLSGLEEPLALGVTRDAILWATYDKVFRLSRTGGPPRTYAIALGQPKGVTEFDGVIYAAGMGGLFRVQVDDGAALLLDLRGMTGLTLGCDGLYGVGWFESILVRYGR
jgi:hypothetical protein